MARLRSIDPITTFTTFGDMLKFLRRRARLTQQELSIAVGYSPVHISRFEGSQRPPDDKTLLALFVPVLDLEDEPELVAQLLHLARKAREKQQLRVATTERVPLPSRSVVPVEPTEAIPVLPAHAVARPQTLAWLQAQLRAERGLAVCGLAGMGKTTLAAAIAHAQARTTAPVFWLTFTTGVTTSVEVVVRQLARFLLAHKQMQVTPLLARNDLALDEQVAMLGAGLAALTWQRLEDSGSAAPSLPLLCFDNAHLVQADAAIWQMLQHLLATAPIALLLTSRVDIQLPGVFPVHLGGLELSEGLALIAQFDAGLSPELATQLCHKTDGSPMLLRLALGQLRNRRLDPAHLIAHLEHEPQVAAYLLETTLRHLPPHVWRLIALVAVFRQPIDLHDATLIDLIQTLDDPYDLPTAITDAQRYQLIDHPAQAALHPLLHDQVYATLAADRPHKHALHCIAGEWSEQAGQVVEAAYHYACADNVERAVEQLTDQQHLLIERGQAFAAVEVIDDLQRWVRRHSNPPSLSRHLLMLRGDLLVGTFRAAEAEADYRRALKLTDQPIVYAQLAARLAESLVQRGQMVEAIQVCQTTSAPLDAGHPLLLAQLAVAESRAHLFLTDYQTAQCTAQLALPLVEQFTHEAPQIAAEIRVQAHHVISVALRSQQHYDQSGAHLQQAITAAHQAGLQQLENRCHIEMVQLLFAQGLIGAAIERATATLPSLYACNDNYALARMLSSASLSYLMYGQPDLALQMIEQACKLSESIGDTPALQDARLRQSRILLTLDRLAEARMIIQQLLLRATASNGIQLQTYALDRLSMVQMIEGDADAAVETLQQALALLPAVQDGKLQRDLHHDLALALLLTGQGHAADDILAQEPSLDTITSASLEHQLIRCLVMLGQGTDPRLISTLASNIATQAGAEQRLYGAVARRLAAAPAAPPLATFPRLLWVAA